MAEALLRRTLALCGISNNAVPTVADGNRHPTREFMASSGLTHIDDVVDFNQKELTSMMEKHNREWPNDARTMGVKPMNVKNIFRIAFYIKELNFQGLQFDPDEVDDATWEGISARMSYHETHKSREHGRAPKFDENNYFDWYDAFTAHLKTCYCAMGLCTLNALNKDDAFDEDDADELSLRDHRWELTGEVFNILNAMFYLVFVKCTKDTPAEALCEEHENNGVECLNSIKGQYEGDPQRRARRLYLEERLPLIIFRGDGTDDITDYISQLTGTFTKLFRLKKFYTDDDKVTICLRGIRCTKLEVITIVVTARTSYADNYNQCCVYLTTNISVVCPKTAKVGAKRGARQISESSNTIRVGGFDVPLDKKVPDSIWLKLSPAQQQKVRDARPRNNGGRNSNRGGGRGNNNGRGRGPGQGRGGGRGRGGYHNNYQGRGYNYGRGRGGYGRGRGGRYYNNNNRWNNNGNNSNDQGNNGNDQRNVNEANAERNGNNNNQNNGTDNHNGRGVQWDDRNVRQRPDQQQSNSQQQQGNGNRGGQAGSAFGRGAYRG
mmetsp:Transcript_38822/g.82850  ORF Transcript_38822/g.82850 Transcript_38822/m.82850 type:complete len:550 (-) Transcript_38822:3659-5308(-)